MRNLRKNKDKTLLIFLGVLVSITSFAFTYGVVRTFGDQNTVSEGTTTNTVYVNDFAEDYYYYTGQNYTYSSNMTTPTLEDKDIYNDSNLVEVTINYHGTDKENKYTGYVSMETGERQKDFVYYKIYPVENNYIDITLIDNPFSYHPNDLSFNGWITDYVGASISYDSVYYERHLKVPVTFTSGKPNAIEINVYARWTKEKVVYVNGNTTFANVVSSLDTGEMHTITLDTNLYGDPSVAGYYVADTITTTTTVSGNWWNPTTNTVYGTCSDCYLNNGTYYGPNNPYQCPAPNTGWNTGTFTNDCTIYYKLTANDTYDPNETYYELRGNSMREITLSPVVIGTKDDDLFDSNMNMSGYFRQRSISRNSSIAGYYSNTGVLQSGNCTSNSCTVYELIQYYDSSNNPSLYNSNQTYYYLATRDTNVVVMNGNYTGSWNSSFTRPFTLTGIHNGHDYDPTWNVNSTSVIAYVNLRVENLTISTTTGNSNTAPSINTSASRVFYANYFNVKLGRNIRRSGNYVNFDSVQGGMNVSRSTTIGSSGSPKRYKFEVESGFYNAATETYGATTTTNNMPTSYIEMYMIYGNDYDRATGTNTNLDLYYSSAASWSGYLHSSNDTSTPVVTTIVKSGDFGTGHNDLTTGIYAGARYGGSHSAPRVLKIEGGHIYNVVGAPSTDSSKASLTALNVYMTGGTVDLMTGGAGTSTTYGNRILQVTGGKVNYGVVGGSNGVDGTRDDGTLTGDSYIYIGGTAVIGDDTLITNESDMYGVYSGTVFGAGNGNQTYDTIGSVKNSNIVINDEAVIKQNVYGSGNFGTAGYSASSSSTTNIKLVGGTVNGSVFGSGNNSGSGKENTVVSTINITLNGGRVDGAIYGGSNEHGKVYGSTNISLVNGTIVNAYGGGYGEDTFVERNVIVNVGTNATTSLSVTGDVYGGSAFGTVNSTVVTSTESTYTTTVNVNNGNINNVYGGGKGDSTHEPCVAGDITVNVNGGNVSNVFGGNNANGTPVGDVVVNINNGAVGNAYGGNNVGGTTPVTHVNMIGGTVTTLYGGGKQATTATTNVSITGGTVTNAFGGGQSANVTTKSNITLTSGTIVGAIYGGSNQTGTVRETLVSINSNVPTVYGGNNAGGTTTTSSVYLNSGTIGNAYGGGNNAETSVTNISLNGSSVTNVYGGGNSAGAGTTNVNLVRGSAVEAYGGSNSSGTVSQSNVRANNAAGLTVSSVYGGNNAGGKTVDARLSIDGGTYTNVYGGGNNAETDYTNVNVSNITVTGDFFGGGNNANVNYNTYVVFDGSSISGDLFGGGNLGEILGNTTVTITDSTISGSAYAGGNGATAIVYGNTLITVGSSSQINQHVFGGGNAANTGTSQANSSLSVVNIAGATINGNVYGGANTAVLYGVAKVNVGYMQDSNLRSDVLISGTVFGGGEANASGSTEYDFSFIGVTEGIEVYIDGGDYTNLDILGSIFGSGNASSTEGYSYINIYNYGTFNNYKENISIQRTDVLTIKNSAIKLHGAKDRTNEFSAVEFTLSRVTKLVLANDSTLFLDTGANLLTKFYSQKIQGNTTTKASVTIAANGTVTKNVNNRIYMYEGKNLNIATNENATAPGVVSGMTFFGMYQLDRNGRVMTALYDNAYDAGDTAASGALYAFTSGSYVWGEHHSNHNIQVDGFYSNYADEENEGQIKVDYVEPSPPDAGFYRWVIGETVTTYEVELMASKYSTLGTLEVPLIHSAQPNTTFQILGFNYQDLESGFSLVDPSTIPRINNNGTADTVMGLSLEPSNTGFITSGSTSFLTNAQSPILGNRSYTSENSQAIPTLLFYLHHSKNITLARSIGTVVISLQTVTPVDELNVVTNRVNINVSLSSALFNNNDYEGAMTTGEKYDLFASSATNINTKSTLSAYYSVYAPADSNYYKTGYHHALTSNFVFPVNTKITMLDLVDDETYYYVVDSSEYSRTTTEFNLNGDCSYNLSNFIKMGSTSTNNNFNESNNTSRYYDSTTGMVQEEFIFIVNFEDTNITGNKLGNILLLELRNANDATLVSVLGIQHASLTYNLYDNSDAILDISGSLGSNTVYIGDLASLNLTGNFTQPIVNSLPVVDTSHFNKKPGVKITIYDSNNNQLNNSSLFGLAYQLDSQTYYPRMDGSVRIALADRVANIFKRIKIDTSNLNLTSGNYTLKIEAFTSPDGIYYGKDAQDTLTIPFRIINNTYGLKVKLTDSEMIINKITGLTLNDDNVLDFKVNYSSSFEDPNIHVQLYRRKYDEVYSTSYDKVDLADYVTNNLVVASGTEYIFTDNPVDNMSQELYLKSGLVSGTYKFVFSLYDGNAYIGDTLQYVIIK